MTTFLSTLRTLDAAATKAPWEKDGPSALVVSRHSGPHIPPLLFFGIHGQNVGSDRDLIAFLRNHAAAIIGCVEAAQAFVDSETPDEGVCDNPDCAICPSLSQLRRALAALEGK